jgi:phosphomannomutase/phosphoglucomutase
LVKEKHKNLGGDASLDLGGNALGRLFGSNGVRGVANKDFTVDLVTRLSAACGSILGRGIAVGRDFRITSPMFRDVAVSSLLSIGCIVHDFGVLPTPALQYSIKHLKLDGGLMITASHNPPQYNGMKVMASDGVELPRSVEERVEELTLSGRTEATAWDRIGEVRHLDVLPIYIDAILSQVDVAGIIKSGFKVAIDPGNGTGTLVAPTIVQRLGCRVYSVNSEPDGNFPGRESEPRPDNLDSLRDLVRATGSDMGVAFDGDADRSLFLDEHGDVLWGDRTITLIAKEYMARHRGARVVTPVSSSRAITDVVQAGGGSILLTRVGSVEISRAMVEHGIDLGGEETGGVLYGPHHPVRDGCMAMALILDIMSRREKPLSALDDELPRYYQAKDRVRCPNSAKNGVLEILETRVKAPHVDKMDGLKLIFDDMSWILVRPSGTEPIFRLYAEADTQERADELVAVNKRLIEETVEGFNYYAYA